MHIVAANQQAANDIRRYVTSCLILALAFLFLMLAVVFVPAMSRVDELLGQSLQTLRSPMLDKLMLGITMMADFAASASVIGILCLLLLLARRWWLAIHLACVYIAARMSVVVLKLSIARARPQLPEGSLEFFSFPSGHACAAAVATGVVSLVIAYGTTGRLRYAIIGAGLVITLLVAVSRVYLLAHWPTDVIAGAILGYILVIAFAWQLHSAATLEIKNRKPTLLILCILCIGLYVYFFYAGQIIHYGIGL